MVSPLGETKTRNADLDEQKGVINTRGRGRSRGQGRDRYLLFLKWYYDQKIISFFSFQFWKRIRLTSNWQNFELCVLSEGCLFWG